MQNYAAFHSSPVGVFGYRDDNTARSSAKSKYSCWFQRVHSISLGRSAVVLRIIQSMERRQSMGEVMQSCRSPDFSRISRIDFCVYDDNSIKVTSLGGTP